MKNWHQFVFYNSKKAEESKLSQNTRRAQDKNVKNFNFLQADTTNIASILHKL